MVTVVRPAPVMVPDASSETMLLREKSRPPDPTTMLPAEAIKEITVPVESIFVTLMSPVFAVIVWFTAPVLETSVTVRSVPSVVMLNVCAALKLAKV